MRFFVRAQVSDRRETPRIAKKNKRGRIFPAVFFKHDAEIGQKDHFGTGTIYIVILGSKKINLNLALS